ncbi:MAG TPA: hypothetical protein VL485_21460, partial [Ktedonobacteraceae bacterium]|nr:hypothetical protein [Ktedonobacteraceae bacterium]
IMQSVTSQGGKVMVGEASQIEGQLADFTTTLNNVGLALEGAATLLNTLSGNIPNACATGFSPKGPHPVFAGNAFDGEKNNGKANRSGTSDGSDEPFEDEPYYDEIDPPESMLNDPRLQNLIDRVVQIPGIEPEEWSTLNAYQRAQVLQAVDHEIAAAYGITPDHVRIASLPDDITGYFREENGTKFVTINHTALGSDEYSEEEVLEALAHEVRHSYQHDMMLQDPATQSASDRELAQKWRENNENYNNGEDDLETYKNQPVEVDAREWAVAFMTKLCE